MWFFCISTALKVQLFKYSLHSFTLLKIPIMIQVFFLNKLLWLISDRSAEKSASQSARLPHNFNPALLWFSMCLCAFPLNENRFPHSFRREGFAMKNPIRFTVQQQ